MAENTPQLDKDVIKKLVDGVSYEDLKVLREQAQRKIVNIRQRDRCRFTIYLPKDYVSDFERAKEWAFKKGLLKRNTKWAFCKFALANIIDMISKQIEQEKQIVPQAVDNTSSTSQRE